MLEYADTAGFYTYQLAEHHLTPLGGTPSPSVFIAAASQRTKRIRLGALVYILPLYLPVRLAQEICMLDHLSGGRIDVGTGRGVSPLELGGLDVPYAEAASRYKEEFDLLIEALSTGKLAAHDGEHYHFDAIDIVIRPVQKPYPPLWYPVGSDETVRWLGSQAINTVSLSEDMVATRKTFAIYDEAYEKNRADPARLNAHEDDPKKGLMRTVYVAEDHERAVAEARTAFARHRGAFFHLWELHNMAEPYYGLRDFEGNMQRGGVIVGTPSEVQERLAGQLDASGANYVAANFTFGDLSNEQVMDSIGLFATEVMPKLP
jgi:alkanesulfonate monooxygenase SsuD/methylene tetrahydromethanopterin reductase-like flavin-dependent oxidoreductase (luciferase family)